MAVCHCSLPSMLIIFLFFLLFLAEEAACSRPAGVVDPPRRPVERLWSFKHLEGSKRGDKREGIETVRQYLQRYGYYPMDDNINNASSSYSYDQILTSDEFDQVLESSLKDFQRFYNLNVTGMLDEATASLMSTPRCGVPDHHHDDIDTLHPNYWFPGGTFRWPTGDMNLRYIVLDNPYTEEPITRAFNAWAGVSGFKFQRVREENFAQIKLRFLVLGGTAWADAGTISEPFTGAVIRFDSESCWSTQGPDPACVHFESVATHEVGHTLGLGHSPVGTANMFAFIGTNTIRPLTQDDIDGITALYRNPL